VTSKVKTNLPASILARLLAESRKTGTDNQLILAAYAYERFLARLAHSTVIERFVLKGAMLLRTWSDHPYRSTRDLDFLRRGDAGVDAIRHDIETISAARVEPDGLEFDLDSLVLEPIRIEDEYGGTRATMRVYCGKVRIPIQIDIGIGDAVFPPPQLSRYATILGMEEPEIYTYARETVVAEKLEAMIVLGERNSRIKDFFDIRYLAETFEFDRRVLRDAIRSTLSRRATPIPVEDPIGMTAAYWENPMRPAQVRAFARRSGLAASVETGGEILSLIRSFLLPILDDVRGNLSCDGRWPPGGPWQAQ